MIVGVTGMDASGKSMMATLLAEELLRSGHSVQIIRVDDFHRPRAERRRDDVPEPVQFYERTFDFERIGNELLSPIRNNGRINASLLCLDLLEDTWSVKRDYVVDEATVVLLEGVFLFRLEIVHFLDLVIYLHVDESTVLDRASDRDVPIHGEEIMGKYRSKYLPAQRAYLEDSPAEIYADVIIDNNDWRNPVAVKWPK